ncbi:hypothetical protein PPTG_04616 [Phytophthora nicotianae INRA-310]|uniref:C2H2-type domain-containing protein n=1 Tax=Phytophthora nicotianae (strain INRA-310) TaxID=761204 RepID=W2R1U7_PHYN3|nr:hypothetical protein PPTG_04616 [Phytophthora nicotianae INRA-310]ETN19251.1 hypothetical protein PPTG_04616 [Phytophthora nicotianae INRA-310]
MCEHCVLPCTSRRHLANHRRYCTDNPDKVKSKKARAEADARGGHCDKCNRDFKKRNALYQHNHGRHPNKPGESDSDVYIESDANVDAESEEESADESEEGSEEEVSSNGDGSEAESEAWSDAEGDAESAEDSE